MHVSNHRIRYNLNKEEFIQLAAGSVNITSDYDVTLIGIGASQCCKNIISDFILNKDIGYSLPEIADSNIYIAPSGIIYPEKNHRGIKLPSWLNVYVYDKKLSRTITNIDRNLITSEFSFFPLPITDIAIQQDIANLKLKWTKRGKSLGQNVIKNYKDMCKFGNELEKFYYSSDIKIIKENEKKETEFWSILGEIGQYASEAYVSISTIIVVVVEYQIDKKKQSVESLKKINYYISALENMCDLWQHAHLKNMEDILNIDNENFLNLSKYIDRIWYSLIRSDEIEEKDQKYTDLLEDLVKKKKADGEEREIIKKSKDFNNLKDEILSRLIYYKDNIFKLLDVNW